MSSVAQPVDPSRVTSPQSVEPEDIDDERLYTPSPGEAQLSVRAVVVGCLIGGVVSAMNIYMGLQIGWSFGGSLIAAILGFAFFLALGKKLSVLETNITQTTGSAAGTMSSAAGLLAAIPAMQLLGFEISMRSLFIWALAIAYLGVFFAVPLRRQMVEIDKLRFPTGTATAQTIMAMFAKAEEAVAKARWLIGVGLAAFAFTVLTGHVDGLDKPNIAALGGVFAAAATWTFSLYFGPMLFGAGILMGMRVGLSMMVGAVVGWALLGPFAQQAGWAPGTVMSYADGARGWLLWPGVAIMVSEALTSLAMNWKTFLRALSGTRISMDEGDDRIPNTWWTGGLVFASIGTVILAQAVFDIPWYLSIVAIVLSAVLSVVATRSVGETDINPIGGMGKVTQLVYGGIAPGAMGTNLMAAAITGAGASQAGDMMQDLKTGHMLGASPRKQFIAQLIGIASGVFFAIPAYVLLTSAYELGGEKLPAPAAMAWKAMAELLAKGLDSLPPMAGPAVLVGVIFGALIPILRRSKKLAPYLPSGLAFGIAFIIPAFYSMTIFFGAAALTLWKKARPVAAGALSFAVASGLVAGEGIGGIVNAAYLVITQMLAG